MSKEWKLVPVELTEAMREAYEANSIAPIGPISKYGYRAMLYAAPVADAQEPAAWANDQQLLLCSKSPREVQPSNPMMHDLPRNIAGSALKTDYCNTPLFTRSDAGEVEALRRELVDTREAFLNQSARLVNAEQRNAELEQLLTQSFSAIDGDSKWNRLCLNILCALKPTESGAEE